VFFSTHTPYASAIAWLGGPLPVPQGVAARLR